jgi:hypothetical protein
MPASYGTNDEKWNGLVNFIESSGDFVSAELGRAILESRANAFHFKLTFIDHISLIGVLGSEMVRFLICASLSLRLELI